jgi:hypothetical protein
MFASTKNQFIILGIFFGLCCGRGSLFDTCLRQIEHTGFQSTRASSVQLSFPVNCQLPLKVWNVEWLQQENKMNIYQ